MRQHTLRGARLLRPESTATPCRLTRRGRRRPRLRGLDLDVVGKGERALDEGTRAVDRAANRGDLGHARGEETRHVDHGSAVRAVRLDVEHADDGRIVRVLDRAIDRSAGVRGDGECR